MTKRILLGAGFVLGLAGCATTPGGGGGGGGVFEDCYTDYCVEYDGLGYRQLYLRTPGRPATAERAGVTTSAGRGGTQVVDRGPSAPAVAARMSPSVSARPSGPAQSGGSRP
jgi:hypothetical protein